MWRVWFYGFLAAAQQNGAQKVLCFGKYVLQIAKITCSKNNRKRFSIKHIQCERFLKEWAMVMNEISFLSLEEVES
jgi:predicted rRNA methylase YqxC with S4 and FtsJ domains